MVQYRETHLAHPPEVLLVKAAPASTSRSSPWGATHPVLWFAQRYPFVFWSGLFSSIMLLTALATTFLLMTPAKPEVERIRVAPAPVAALPTPQPANEFAALWALGGITASCAVVSLLLTTSLGVAQQRRRLIKHSKPAPNSEPRHKAPLDFLRTAPIPATPAVAETLPLAANLTPIAPPLPPDAAKKSASKTVVTPAK
jgi:hypothetical protein